MTWATEAEMVADFVAWAEPEGWTAYAETAGWDLLLVRAEDGFQIGVEAKLSLNAKVLVQVLEHDHGGNRGGPDCQAVLVPRVNAVQGLAYIANRLGIVVITASEATKYSKKGFSPRLPKTDEYLMDWREEWPERCPDQRCHLPEYVPDVSGGKPSPVALTNWKIAALKAVVIMEFRGAITRGDFKALKLSSSRWTQFWLRSNGEGGWVPTARMPDFKAQHPVNYEQIKADFETWKSVLPAYQPSLAAPAEHGVRAA
jgi:hypothetical protein